MSFNRRAARPLRNTLSVALLAASAALALPASAAGPYTQTVFFGDSLTDSGFFRPLLPASVRAAVMPAKQAPAHRTVVTIR